MIAAVDHTRPVRRTGPEVACGFADQGAWIARPPPHPSPPPPHPPRPPPPPPPPAPPPPPPPVPPPPPFLPPTHTSPPLAIAPQLGAVGRDPATGGIHHPPDPDHPQTGLKDSIDRIGPANTNSGFPPPQHSTVINLA